VNHRTLLSSQKNDIYSLIKKAGIDPSSFFWSEVNSENHSEKMISRLCFINSDFFYSFEIKGNSHFAVFSPGKNSIIDTCFPGVWTLQQTSFQGWLENLIRISN